jgi:uncharacterized protein
VATSGGRGGLFLGPDGRPWPVIRVGLYLLAYASANMVLAMAVGLVVAATAPGALDLLALNLLTPLGLLIVLASTALTAMVTWGFCRFVDRRSWLALGLRRERGWLGELLGGLAVGAGLMALVTVAEIATGAYRVEGAAVTGRAVASLLMALVLYGLVAFGEELLARGYVLRTLAEGGWGAPAAAVSSSLIFALLHAGNPGAGPTSILGVFAAGVMLAVGYVRTGRLWLPIGVHWTWNLFQGPVFGFPVSGTEAAGLLRLTPVGPELLTGGDFGPEASAIGVLACLVGAAILGRWPVRRDGAAAACSGAVLPPRGAGLDAAPRSDEAPGPRDRGPREG